MGKEKIKLKKIRENGVRKGRGKVKRSMKRKKKVKKIKKSRFGFFKRIGRFTKKDELDVEV